MHILIDPGHGGEDSGAAAMHGNLRIAEKDINLTAGHFLRAALEKQGHTTNMTREVDIFKTLDDRVQLEHDLMPQLFISIHCNYFHLETAHGFEAFTSIGQTGSDAYATRIITAISKAYPEITIRDDHGDDDPDKEANFYVLRNTRGSAVLLELGFISNPVEAKRLLDRMFIQEMMGVVAEAV